MIPLQLAVGGILAGAAIGVVRAALPAYERHIWAATLTGAALVYVALALGAGLSTELLVETIGAIAFAKLALTGLLVSPWLLAVGWAAHAAWDVLIPTVIDTSFVPSWYVVVCIGFDLVVAFYLAVVARGSRSG
jgi:hypothetical protein